MSAQRPGARGSVVISGYYGFSNTGDEAILEATIQGIRRHLPGVDQTVLCANAEEWARRTGVRCIPRYDVRAFWPYLRRGGVFVSGGGGLFQDTTSRKSLYYYLGLLALAHRRGMKTFVYAQGLGPLHHASSRSAVRFVLRQTDRISFRDEASAQLLADLGIPGRAEVTADPAFTLEPADDRRVGEILSQEGVPPGASTLAIAIRPWEPITGGGRQAMADSLAQLVDRTGVHPLFVNMQQPGDGLASAEMAERMGRPYSSLKGSYTPVELAGVLRSARALVAMRLHAIILAASAGVPCLALSYDPKVDAIAGKLGLPPPLDVRCLESAAIEQRLQSIVAADPSARDQIRAAAAHERDLAEQNFHIMAELLSES